MQIKGATVCSFVFFIILHCSLFVSGICLIFTDVHGYFVLHATAAYLTQNWNGEIAINIFQDAQQHFISCVKGPMCNISNCSIGMK